MITIDFFICVSQSIFDVSILRAKVPKEIDCIVELFHTHTHTLHLAAKCKMKTSRMTHFKVKI